MSFQIVTIGTSLGGLRALEQLLGGLPATFLPAVVIAQHRHRDSDRGLALLLQAHCPLPVSEAHDKEPIRGGHVYLAPADYHLLVEAGTFALSTEAPVHYARPAIDVLFCAASDSYGAGVIGVILTGASHDGAQGLAAIEGAGGTVLVQEPRTAECRVMPEGALAACVRPLVVPLLDMAPTLVALCHPTPR